MSKISINDKISSKLCYLLRHNPESIGGLNEDGYASVDRVCNQLSIDFFTLRNIVNSDEKNRYSLCHFKVLGTDTSWWMIRANYGHSVDLKIEHNVADNLPRSLYHGTSIDNLRSIIEIGLTPQSRKHVHMTSNIEDAWQVGLRHTNKVESDTIILIIDTSKLSEIQEIRKTGGNVYLSDNVPFHCVSGILRKRNGGFYDFWQI